MANSDNKGVARLLKAAQFSWQGFRAAYKHEEAFKQEVLILLIAVPLALWLGDDGVEKALMIGSLLLLLIVELLNSAIESAIDRIGTERHELSGRAKDMGSAAVLLATINAILVWFLMLS
ncbi:MAG: Diacylglycerol kinase (EC [uncultured Thiotrichaceae bacterium]|uniref:Diacylglycerol kinase n=1 Tax=uncultured Thiotrichaceae bacterium TaxID=298394 RepID=A0A6S6T0J0_9GAMM|nr:MAG: Diacylglycerol kinase (EC [uncultured Thiotrichaceae bacterium]